MVTIYTSLLAIVFVEGLSTISLITNINSNRLTVGITNNEETIYGLISNYDKNKNEITISELTKDINITDELNVITFDKDSGAGAGGGAGGYRLL